MDRTIIYRLLSTPTAISVDRTIKQEKKTKLAARKNAFFMAMTVINSLTARKSRIFLATKRRFDVRHLKYLLYWITNG